MEKHDRLATVSESKVLLTQKTFPFDLSEVGTKRKYFAEMNRDLFMDDPARKPAWNQLSLHDGSTEAQKAKLHLERTFQLFNRYYFGPSNLDNLQEVQKVSEFYPNVEVCLKEARAALAAALRFDERLRSHPLSGWCFISDDPAVDSKPLWLERLLREQGPTPVHQNGCSIHGEHAVPDIIAVRDEIKRSVPRWLFEFVWGICCRLNTLRRPHKITLPTKKIS